MGTLPTGKSVYFRSCKLARVGFCANIVLAAWEMKRLIILLMSMMSVSCRVKTVAIDFSVGIMGALGNEFEFSLYHST